MVRIAHYDSRRRYDLIPGGPHADSLTGDAGTDVIKGQAGAATCAEPTDTLYSC